MKQLLTLLFITITINQFTFSQSTYSEVLSILRTNCSGNSGCHGTQGGASSVISPNFFLSDNDVYNNIIGVAPNNPAAAAKGDKLIDPGYPSRSFLLRKIAHCISGDLALSKPQEGADMPVGRPKLDDVDIEFIRQWILFGADLNKNYANPGNGYSGISRSSIEDYYSGKGIQRMAQPSAPDSCSGIQIHMGPIFFQPREEAEYFYKFDLNLPDTIEINRMELFMTGASHHMILRKFKPGTKQSHANGLIPLGIDAFSANKDYIMAWQGNLDIQLPGGTAYKWLPSEALDLNFHMANYYDSVLVGDVYLNIYTQPKGTAEKEMKSDLVTNVNINLTPSSNPIPQTLQHEFNKTNISLWSITSHTHKLGIDYNIWLRDKNTFAKDIKVFEGKAVDGTPGGLSFGFYDWAHPPNKYYEPFLFVDPVTHNGFIHEATYLNNTGSTVRFGFTTEDEMMIFYTQYVEGNYQAPANFSYTPPCYQPLVSPCEINSSTGELDFGFADKISFITSPNPFSLNSEIRFTLPKQAQAQLEVYDNMGRKVKTFANTKFAAGTYTFNFNPDTHASGMYIVRLMVDGKSYTKRIIRL